MSKAMFLGLALVIIAATPLLAGAHSLFGNGDA